MNSIHASFDGIVKNPSQALWHRYCSFNRGMKTFTPFMEQGAASSKFWARTDVKGLSPISSMPARLLLKKRMREEMEAKGQAHAFVEKLFVGSEFKTNQFEAEKILQIRIGEIVKAFEANLKLAPEISGLLLKSKGRLSNFDPKSISDTLKTIDNCAEKCDESLAENLAKLPKRLEFAKNRKVPKDKTREQLIEEANNGPAISVLKLCTSFLERLGQKIDAKKLSEQDIRPLTEDLKGAIPSSTLRRIGISLVAQRLRSTQALRNEWRLGKIAAKKELRALYASKDWIEALPEIQQLREFWRAAIKSNLRGRIRNRNFIAFLETAIPDVCARHSISLDLNLLAKAAKSRTTYFIMKLCLPMKTADDLRQQERELRRTISHRNSTSRAIHPRNSAMPIRWGGPKNGINQFQVLDRGAGLVRLTVADPTSGTLTFDAIFDQRLFRETRICNGIQKRGFRKYVDKWIAHYYRPDGMQKQSEDARQRAKAILGKSVELSLTPNQKDELAAIESAPKTKDKAIETKLDDRLEVVEKSLTKIQKKIVRKDCSITISIDLHFERGLDRRTSPSRPVLKLNLAYEEEAPQVSPKPQAAFDFGQLDIVMYGEDLAHPGRHKVRIIKFNPTDGHGRDLGFDPKRALSFYEQARMYKGKRSTLSPKADQALANNRNYRHKRAAAEICKICREEGWTNVVGEDLDSFSMRHSGMTKFQNRLFTEWSPAKLRPYLEDCSKKDGIKIDYRNPRMTSQVCSQCQKPTIWRYVIGKNIHGNKTPIHAKCGVACICSECGFQPNSNVNAAKNLLARGQGAFNKAEEEIKKLHEMPKADQKSFYDEREKKALARLSELHDLNEAHLEKFDPKKLQK